jgi:hypothetical protein
MEELFSVSVRSLGIRNSIKVMKDSLRVNFSHYVRQRVEGHGFVRPRRREIIGFLWKICSQSYHSRKEIEAHAPWEGSVEPGMSATSQ